MGLDALIYVTFLMLFVGSAIELFGKKPCNKCVLAETSRLTEWVPEYTEEEREIFTENVRNAGVADNMYIEDAVLALKSVGCSAKEAKSIVDKLASEKMYYSFEEFLADAIRAL